MYVNFPGPTISTLSMHCQIYWHMLLNHKRKVNNIYKQFKLQCTQEINYEMIVSHDAYLPVYSGTSK